MEKSGKSRLIWRSEEEPCEISLQFHATRVPESGRDRLLIDKLVIALVSVESGKIVSRTSRGLVNNGTCRWSETLVETFTPTRNPRSGDYKDKLYKLVVQMGSLSSGILGETVINLSDFIGVESPRTISLPLANCNAGTILHVKVQCLTQKPISRSASFEQQESESGLGPENDGSSFNQAKNTVSFGSQARSVRSHLSTAQLQAKTSRSSSPPGLQRGGLAPQSYNCQAKCTNFNVENRIRVPISLPQMLEVAETTIQEIRGESLMWEHQAGKLGVEVERLKQQLMIEEKNGLELKVEMSAREADCASLRSQVEQLKTSRLSSKKWDHEDVRSWRELEDARCLIRQLQEEANYEKEFSEDLHMQLRKTQDSNSELVSIVTELEAALELENCEVERLTEANRILEEQLQNIQQSNKKSLVANLDYYIDDDQTKLRNEASEWDQNLMAAESQFIQTLQVEEEDLKALKEQDESTDSSLDPNDSAYVTLDRDTISQVDFHEAQVDVDEKLADRVACENRLKMDLQEAQEKWRSLNAYIQELLEERKGDRLLIEELESQISALSGDLKYLNATKDELASGLEEKQTDMKGKLECAQEESMPACEQLEEVEWQMALPNTTLDSDLAAQRAVHMEDSELEREKEDLEDPVFGFKSEGNECHVEKRELEDKLMSMRKREDEALCIEKDMEPRATELGALNALHADLMLKLEAVESNFVPKERLEVGTYDKQDLKAGVEKLCSLLQYTTSQYMSLQLENEQLQCKLSKEQEEMSEVKTKFFALEEERYEIEREIKSLEEKKTEFERRIKALEDDLAQKENALARIQNQEDATAMEVTCVEQRFLERETDLLGKIDALERLNEQLVANGIDSETDQLRNELIRLQNQNSDLSKREHDLLSKLHVQEVLQAEVRRLEEANDLLEARLMKFMETAKNPFLLEKIVNLETELAEAVESRNMYKLQLCSIFEREHNLDMVAVQELGGLDQVIDDLYQYKRKVTELETELQNLHERYSVISLQLAEAEEERGELLINLKSLKINKKT